MHRPRALRHLTILLLIAATLVASPGLAQAGGHEIEAEASLDGPLIIGTASVTLGLYAIKTRTPAFSGPLPALNWFDAFAPLTRDDTSAFISDILLLTTLGAGLGVMTYNGIDTESTSGHLAVYAEALLFTSLMNQLFKFAVRRYRPFAYDASYQTGTHDPDDELSFFSGHAAHASAAAFAAARAIDLTRDLSTGYRVLNYSSAAVLALSVGTMRVVAGKHFPSDVLVGALVGAAIGWLVTELHSVDVSQSATGEAAQPLRAPALFSIGGAF